MSLRIRRIALNNFRMFREPLTIDGLTDGLNIVIEPNEAGKSTLLEALRGAFFVRHSTKNQLAQSFAPHGEAVAPEVQVLVLGWTARIERWSTTPFSQRALYRVAGSQYGRGSPGRGKRGTASGVVGFRARHEPEGRSERLWRAGPHFALARADALKVLHRAKCDGAGHGPIHARGGKSGQLSWVPRHERVRARVDDRYKAYWTPTGKSSGKQVEVREREDRSKVAAAEAEARLDALKGSDR